MAGNRPPDNAAPPPRRNRLEEALYTICSQFAICSFRYAGTGPFDTPMESMAPFETGSGPFSLWNPLTCPVLPPMNYARSAKWRGITWTTDPDLQLLGHLRSSSAWACSPPPTGIYIGALPPLADSGRPFPFLMTAPCCAKKCRMNWQNSKVRRSPSSNIAAMRFAGKRHPKLGKY